MKKFFIAALLIVTVATSGFVSAQEPTAAERQGRAFIEALSTGDRAKVRSFLEANFPSERLGNDGAAFLTMLPAITTILAATKS